MAKKVIIYGTGRTGRMIYYDSLNHPTFKIACFTAEEKYLTAAETLFNIPVVSVKKVTEVYPPDEYDMIIADSSYLEMRNRAEIYNRFKSLGYQLTNYISPLCNMEPGIVMGDNNIFFGQAHVGFGGTMGSNNIVRQQVYLGHDFRIGNNNIFAPSSSVGGECLIENSCYIGLGAVVIDKIKIAEGTLIGAGSVVIRNTEPYTRNAGNPSRIIKYCKEDF